MYPFGNGSERSPLHSSQSFAGELPEHRQATPFRDPSSQYSITVLNSASFNGNCPRPVIAVVPVSNFCVVGCRAPPITCVRRDSWVRYGVPRSSRTLLESNALISIGTCAFSSTFFRRISGSLFVAICPWNERRRGFVAFLVCVWVARLHCAPSSARALLPWNPVWCGVWVGRAQPLVVVIFSYTSRSALGCYVPGVARWPYGRDVLFLLSSVILFL